METKGSKELIKSILIMAGIPIAFSVASSLVARIKTPSYQDQINENKEDYIENGHDPNHLKEQILSLRSKILELQELGKEIEVRFFRFIDLKDQEYSLMEVQSSLCMEAEKNKFDEMLIEYLKALEEVKTSRFQNTLLRRREKKLLKKTRESCRLIKRLNLKIEAQEAEMLINEADLKRKDIVIGGFEHQVKEMGGVINVMLDDQKNQIETERVLKEKYDEVVKEVENLKKDRVGEVKEMIYLRWCHACLKHELARRNQIEQERQSEDNKVDEVEEIRKSEDDKVDDEVEGIAPAEEGIGHESDNESVLCHDRQPLFESGERHIKRRWLVRKFKKWVQGNEKHQDTKSHSVVDETEHEPHSSTRKSFSSV